MTSFTKIGVAVALASLTLTGCGGSDGDSSTPSAPTSSTKALPWTLLMTETDAKGDLVLQRLDRVTANDIIYNKTPERIVGGQATISYVNTYYFNDEFFFVQPATTTKYGKPTYLVDDLSDTQMVVSPYNKEKKQYLTHTFNYKVIDLSGKRVWSANNNILAGQPILSTLRFPNGSKCRSLLSWERSNAIGNADLYFVFSDDSSSRTAYQTLDDWQEATLSSTDIPKETLKITQSNLSDKAVPIRFIQDTASDEYYIAAKYNNRVYSVSAVETGVVDFNTKDSCIDYNDTATNYIVKIAKDNFRARPAPRHTPIAGQDVDIIATPNRKAATPAAVQQLLAP